MNKVMMITVRGKRHEWCFEFDGDPKYLDEWREDGLEIDEVLNSVPAWAVDMGLLNVWCFVQDIFRR